jgi:hypothetical protein
VPQISHGVSFGIEPPSPQQRRKSCVPQHATDLAGDLWMGKYLGEQFSKSCKSRSSKTKFSKLPLCLQESAKRLKANGLTDQQAVLAYFGDLFRIGYLAWGYNLSNPSPPFCHLTDSGRKVLADLSRDPSNPDGYLANIRKICELDPVSESYIREALATYNANCFKATAVLVGAAAEAEILALRDILGVRLEALGRPRPSELDDWRIKRVTDCIERLLTEQKKTMPRELFEIFESYWSAFTFQVRASRNAAGHPKSIEPVEEQAVHAALLIFPELLKLAKMLKDWVSTKIYVIPHPLPIPFRA